MLLLQHQVRDLHQFILHKIRKIQMVRDARGKARIAAEEGIHAVFVTGQDHHQVFALVLHHLQQNLDGLLTVVTLVFRAVQVIGLIYEQHTAHGLFQYFLGLGRGVADVLADQVVARHRHHLSAADVTQAMQNLRHA